MMIDPSMLPLLVPQKMTAVCILCPKTAGAQADYSFFLSLFISFCSIFKTSVKNIRFLTKTEVY